VQCVITREFVCLCDNRIISVKMAGLSDFLESSTIHGLTYISTSRSLLIKLFWIIVIIIGFVTAGDFIKRSFDSWERSPVSTTIETLPISKAPFPIINVCPPKDTFTSLNFDLMKADNATFDTDIRNDLVVECVQLYQDMEFGEAIFEQTSFKEENKYLNWYLGFSRIQFSMIKEMYVAGNYKQLIIPVVNSMT
jgi:hypothetical protein